MDGDDRAVRRRVFVPQALGSNEFLRATWHEGRDLIVISHWDGARCTAAIPIRVGEAAELAALLDQAVVDHERPRAPTWPPPSPADVAAPARSA